MTSILLTPWTYECKPTKQGLLANGRASLGGQDIKFISRVEQCPNAYIA